MENLTVLLVRECNTLIPDLLVQGTDLYRILTILDVVFGKQDLVNALQGCKSLGDGITGL